MVKREWRITRSRQNLYDIESPNPNHQTPGKL